MPGWVRLGSGRAAEAAPKAALLDRARHRRLRVPDGFVLLDPVEGALPRLEWPTVAVRSAFAAEDRAAESLAGYFVSRLRVEPHRLRSSVDEVLASAHKRPGRFRRDVIVQAMVEARTAGVAFTERDFEDDLVNYTSGTAEGLVAGKIAGERASAPKLRAGERALPGFLGRLQRMLREVRATFGERDWDIEWADDGRHCWLLQIRPITRAPRRNEAFTLANHKEILPDLPSRFMATLIQECAPKLFDYYRRFDPRLPETRLFIETFAGRPLINVSLLCDMMRRWGLPTSLVTDSIGGTADVEAPPRPGRVLRSLGALLGMALAQAGGATRAPRVARELIAQAAQPAGGFAELVDRAAATYVEVVHTMFSLTAAMSGPLAALRRAGVLAEHSARLRTESTRMYDELDALRGQADAPDFDPRWQAWLERWGHRGVYESDLSRPRFAETPEGILASLRTSRRAAPARPTRTLKGILTLPVWWMAAPSMAARERFRSETMRAFHALRQQLQQRARLAGVEDAIWDLTADEVKRLDTGWRPDAQFLEERRRDIARLAAVRLPDFIRRQDDPESAPERTLPGPLLRGIPLTSGVVAGRAWVLREPATALPEGYDPATTVLVAPSVDAGWIPSFALAAAVVVETGGDLSHGSIILREIGIPAITNVAGASAIRPGQSLRVHAAAGIVELERENG